MFTRYSDELIEEIRINNDIVDVVTEYVKLEKKGKNYFGLCPFHREKTPSFSVESTKQIFYCFGCGKGGNVFQFVSLAEKIDFIEAVRLLAERAKIALPESSDKKEAEKAKLKRQILNINHIAARYYYDALNTENGEAAAAYLKKRGISEQTARKFGLGYALDEWDSLYSHLKVKGIAEELIRKSGLVVDGRKGRVDRFRGRLMFPIFDAGGNIMAFGGRVLDDSLPKYMNSPETIVYNKGKHLYALNFAKKTDAKNLIVVEGYMDVVSLYQSGIDNVVASLGTAMTESQARTLKKYTEEVIISYDADVAGQAAAVRGLNLLGDIGCNVRVLIVPDAKDPDEYVRKKGPDSFRKLADNALPLVEYKIKVLKSKHDISSIDGKVAFLNKAAAVLTEVGNVIEREMYIKKLSREYEISEEAMLSEVLRRSRPSVKQSRRIAIAVDTANKALALEDEIDEKIISGERFMLSLLCVDNSIYQDLKKHYPPDRYYREENKRIAEIIYKNLDDRVDFTSPELLNIVSPDETGEYAKILNNECHCDDNRKAILGKIKDIEILKKEKKQKQVLGQLKDKSNLPKGDVEKLKLELKNLTLEIKNIKSMSI